MNHFIIAYQEIDDNISELCEFAERSDEAIKNALNDIPILKNNNNFKFRFTNESDLEWLSNMGNFSIKNRDIDSLTKEDKSIIKEIKDHINNIFHWLKNSFKSILDF